MLSAFFDGNLTKTLSAIFLFLVVMAALGVAVFDLVTNQPMQAIVTTILGIAIGHATTMLGISTGISTSNNVTNQAISNVKEVTNAVTTNNPTTGQQAPGNA